MTGSGFLLLFREIILTLIIGFVVTYLGIIFIFFSVCLSIFILIFSVPGESIFVIFILFVVSRQASLSAASSGRSETSESVYVKNNIEEDDQSHKKENENANCSVNPALKFSAPRR